jgi:DNA-binding NarL/FixJ family response regulator
MAQDIRPDVVLMDIQMPQVNGLEGLRRIRQARPELPVLILTTMQTDETVGQALSAGAKGFLLKDAGGAEIVAAVRAAMRGETTLAPAVTERLAALATGQAMRKDSALTELNEREREVLELLTRGARNKEIAAQLFLSPKTVEYHLSNLFAKLGVSNRTEAVRMALEQGLVVPSNP